MRIIGKECSVSLVTAFVTLSLFSLALAWLFIYLVSDIATERAIQTGFIIEARHTAKDVEKKLTDLMLSGMDREGLQDASRDDVAPGVSLSIRSVRESSIPDLDLSSSVAGRTEVIRWVKKESFVRYLYPIQATELCLSCHKKAFAGDVLGVVDMTFPFWMVSVPLEYSIRTSVNYTLFGMWLMFAILFLTLRFKVLSPIASLVNDIRAITNGRDWSHRVHVNHDINELSSLSDDFNQLLGAAQEEHRMLEDISIKDPLTGLLNRRGFNSALEVEITRYKRHGYVFSIILIDMDKFKFINDTYGHPAGDYVLTELTARMGRCLRDIDCFARVGGDEFIVILPETDADGGFSVATKLRAALIGEPFALPPSGALHPVTASIGVACYPRDGQTEADLHAAVDAALYEAKKKGKDCVAVASASSP